MSGPVSSAVRRAMPRLATFVIAAILATGTAALAAAPAAAAEPVEFGTPTATSAFLVGIDIEQPATLPAGVERVEALVRSGEDGRTFVATVPTPASGATTLRYHLETPSGGMYPNTVVELGFRVTLADGTVVLGPTATVRYEDTRFQWRTLEGRHVRVHWIQGDAGFGQGALNIADRAIDEASALLGVEERDPIDFFIYGDRDAFYDVLGPALQENVGGIALPEIRTLFANIPPTDVLNPWVGVVVPHELTHLVFDTATRNPYHAPPHWLDEGLADYLAQGYDAGMRSNVKNVARSGEIMPLRALIGRFPTTAERFSLAYDESVSAIDYLIRAHGKDALVKLIRTYADGVSDDAAFEAALGVDLAAFEAAWLEDLGADEPQPFGPRPAPPGPLPPGWAAAAPQPGASGQPTPGAVGNPSGAGSGSDLVGPIVIAVGLFATLLLVAGILVTATRLNRGEPLLPSPGSESGAFGTSADPGGSGPSDSAEPPQPPDPDQP